MARNERTPEEFESIARELSEASAAMLAAAAAMREQGMPHALIHGSTTLNRFLPAVLQWVDKTTADVKTQLRAYASGVPSHAELMKQQNETAKKAAAKKPFTPKKTGKVP
ncbi:hypothetical protein [Schlesneria sp. T3-172]|uniref:hypothetical protein n=1 Tax=Schlesneria sphaerica TaxID=3373610 RepID=UPI0037C84CD2